jgi:predicted aspartyl protease
LNAISKACWFIEIKLWDREICFLVDTGSSMSLISDEIFKSLSVTNTKLEDMQTILTTADGDVLSVQGKTRMNLSINDQ